MTGGKNATPDQYVTTALNFIDDKKYSEAKKILLKSHQLFPDDFDTLNYLLFIEAQSNFKHQNFEEEIRLRYKLIEIIESQQTLTGYIYNDITPYLAIGNKLSMSKRYQEAIQFSKRALTLVEEMDNNNLSLKGSLYCRLSIENFELGDYEESLIYADKSLEIDSNNEYLEEIKKTIFDRQNSK